MSTRIYIFRREIKKYRGNALRELRKYVITKNSYDFYFCGATAQF